ncbi:ligand-dependent nuclear receptor corepressor-like protein [Oncorhynchus keta]|uniref:ligand-dependent nuclear receptor corepressor-like protein n=1 Tax=Oncorhynchus keta TaxID=8018 RepID=UPI00227B1FD2|nr:ligand-dependent nuclear receptor corepressor-like protein [Oncorhynchus keta]
MHRRKERIQAGTRYLAAQTDQLRRVREHSGGIYGPLLLRDLNIFDDCEPEELEDWAVKASCSFCSLLINDHVPVAASPSDDTPSQAPSLSDSSLSAHRFLQAVFHKKELVSSGDPNVPLVAQELMKRMVRQFAMEYASKTRLTTTTGSQRSDLDSPLDLTLTRNQEEEPTPADSVLDLSKRNSASSASTSPTIHKASG